MGTFKIITPSTVGTKTVFQTLNGDTLLGDDASLIAGILGDLTFGSVSLAMGAIDIINSAINGEIRFGFSLTDPIISLDGNPPISFNNLPAGFIPTSASLQVQASFGDFSGPDYLYLQLGTLDESSPFTDPTEIIICNFPYDFSSFPTPTILDIISNGFGFRTVFSNIDSSIIIANFLFSGTYQIGVSKFILQNPNNPYYPSDKVKITAPDGGLAPGVKEVHLTYTPPGGSPTIIVIPPYDIIVNQPDQLWFYVPFFPNKFEGPVTITIVPNGTTFTGSVPLGTINVLFADASGIYVLDDTQTHDTLYFRNGYITLIQLIFLQFLLEDEYFDDEYSFYSMLTYPRKILAQDDGLDNEDFDWFSAIGVLQIAFIPLAVEIPSPFIETAFLP